MASTMSRFLLWLSLAACVAAQTFQPSNKTITSSNNIQFILATSQTGMETNYRIDPLTSDAGSGKSIQELQSVNRTGTLIAVTASNADSVNSADIAYISCDDSAYTGMLQVGDAVNMAAQNSPTAILLYSTSSSHCSIQGSTGSYSIFYTMIDAGASEALASALDASNNTNSDATSSIMLDPSLASVSGSSQSSSTSSTQQGGTESSNGSSDPATSLLGPPPTTAVAMIILYSITGVITALFLLIIITGAVRAHRHPERYGPRSGAVGRPRQSRARGIARAMLETLPIVKFGEQPTKPVGQAGDLEMGNNTNENATNERQEGQPISGARHPETEATSTEEESDAAATPRNENPAESSDDETHVCSICTDDFVKGQDIRVLPCNHKYHPECIDPWLLNVSGTCPLCRIDLRPQTSHTSTTGTSESNEDNNSNFSPPLGEETDSGPGRRRSRLIDIINPTRMHHASAEERLAALRRLRHERRTGEYERGQEPNENVGGSPLRPSSRRTTRLLSRFRVRTRRQGNAAVINQIPEGREDEQQQQQGSLGTS
ncbi:MAG: hypothetical protein M1834_003931 [Cirrosporium novae-zelandiae]|nr:MAG: hypothetical protein M1834_003931 [Cirrosporium novae-zelandiae]